MRTALLGAGLPALRLVSLLTLVSFPAVAQASRLPAGEQSGCPDSLRAVVDQLRRQYPDLADSPDVQEIAALARRRGLPSTTQPDRLVAQWIQHLEQVAQRAGSHPASSERLHDLIYRLYRVPESGRPSLDAWIEYFLSAETGHYPFEFKVWAFLEIVRRRAFDRSTGSFPRRSGSTYGAYPELDRRAVDEVFRRRSEQIRTGRPPESFARMYARQLASSGIVWQPSLRPGRIDHPIPGLYASIPEQPLELTDGVTTIRSYTREDGDVIVTGTVEHHGQSVGLFSRRFSRGRDSMSLEGASLWEGAQSFMNVSGITPLVEGRGIPTQALVTLHHMRLAGVRYGGLRLVESYIGNARTAAELLGSEPVREWIETHPNEKIPHSLLEPLFLSTSSGQYMQTFLTQSGHRVTRVEISEVRGSYGDMWAPDSHRGFLTRRGGGSYSSNQPTPTQFRVRLFLEPLPNSRSNLSVSGN